MKPPRKLKKAIKTAQLIYDIASKPHNAELRDITDCYHRTGVVFWDSSQGGDAPKFLKTNKRLKIVKVTNPPVKQLSLIHI